MSDPTRRRRDDDENGDDGDDPQGPTRPSRAIESSVLARYDAAIAPSGKATR